MSEPIIDDALIKCTLQFAVPLWIERWRDQPWDDMQRRARECGEIVASKGDIIMFKSGIKGETANAFNRLAEGLAIASFMPGGINFLDMHFEAHSPAIQHRYKCKTCQREKQESKRP